jgi:hypothetical protein
MEITMKTTLLLSTLAAGLLAVSTASFAYAAPRTAAAVRLHVPANAFNSVSAPVRFATPRPAMAPVNDFQLGGER